MQGVARVSGYKLVGLNSFWLDADSDHMDLNTKSSSLFGRWNVGTIEILGNLMGIIDQQV